MGSSKNRCQCRPQATIYLASTQSMLQNASSPCRRKQPRHCRQEGTQALVVHHCYNQQLCPSFPPGTHGIEKTEEAARE
jgi:hypothetical protein